MKRKGGIINHSRLLSAVLLLLQMFIFALPGQAEVTYYDVSRSIGDAFSGKEAFSMKNIIGTIMTTLFFVLVVLVFRQSWLRKEKELSQKHQNRVELRPLGQQRRRKWYRLRTNIEFKWMPVTGASYHKNHRKKAQYKSDKLVDISAGGLCFKTTEKLSPGDKIKMLIDVEGDKGGDKTLSIRGRVLRVEKEVDQDIEMYKVAVQFEELLRQERERLISFITKSQCRYIQDNKWGDTSSSIQS